MKASLKGRYTNDKSTAAVTLAVNAGDVKLRASMTDATVVNGPSLNGLTLAVEKPGFFIIDYDVPKKDFRFQFMNSARVAEKPLKLTYIHSRGDNRTVLDGALVFDSANKVSANYMLGTRNCKLKYSYVHGGVTTFEPCYDLGKNAWDFAISRRVYGDVFKATYQTWSRDLALEWSRNSKFNGTFKAIHADAIFILNQMNNYFSRPKAVVDAHTMVRSGCIIERTILYGDLRGSFAVMGDKIPTKVAFFDWDAT